MAKNSLSFQTQATIATPTPDMSASRNIEVFSFGDAEGVLDRREIISHLECTQNGKWYEPPYPLKALARVWNISPHHRSAISVKKNLLAKNFIPHPLLSREEFAKWVTDYLVMGNGYLERVDAMSGRPMALKRSLALGTRRGVDEGRWWFINNRWQEHEFKRRSIFQLMEHDVSQEIYGVPEYLSMLQSAFLNEASTLFRRRYYINGAHAGFVFYLNEGTIDSKDADLIREQIRQAKGVGNFKNLFIHAPQGKKDGVQIIPISEVAAKDEFLGIKNTTRDDILASHRVPPQLIGVVPANTGGFGDVEKTEGVFHRQEIEPLQMRFMELNDWIGYEVVRFNPFVPPAASASNSR